MKLEKIIHRYERKLAAGRDVHILRHYSAFVVVSEGRVVYVTDPGMTYCPLAGHLYPGFRNIAKPDPKKIKARIKAAIEAKIREHGHFSGRRQIFDTGISIRYGASEMIMYAMRKNVIDAAVVVCEGAGTVITDNPGIAQGIGKRMNGLFLTSPIKAIQARLAPYHCRFVSDRADIDQIKGVAQAAELGFKRIAVTVNGFKGESLKKIRDLENRYKLRVFIFAICTTGVDQQRLEEIKSYADLVWSCGSKKVREQIGKAAVLQFSRAIPVFVLTEKGWEAARAYFAAPELLGPFQKERQLLVCDGCAGERVRIGDFHSRLREARLPAPGKRSPVYQEEASACK